MRRLLERALRGRTGRELAGALGVSPSTIYRWKKRLPKERRATLESFLAEQKREKQERKSEADDFKRLFARAKADEKLPTLRSKDAPRRGPLTFGWEFRERVEAVLSLSVESRVRAWMLSRPKRFPTWQAVALTTQYGKGQHEGYKTVQTYIQKLGPKAEDFGIGLAITTERSGVREVVVRSLWNKLFEQERKGLTVYLHTVTLYNYRLRTIDEQRKFRTMKARERRKEAEKWRKRKQRTKKSRSRTR